MGEWINRYECKETRTYADNEKYAWQINWKRVQKYSKMLKIHKMDAVLEQRGGSGRRADQRAREDDELKQEPLI